MDGVSITPGSTRIGKRGSVCVCDGAFLGLSVVLNRLETLNPYLSSMPYKDAQKQREYQRDWMRRRREEWLAGKVCVDCGSSENIELDHKDPTQKVSHRIWSWAKEKREAEIAKCEPRCRPCHSARHWKLRREKRLRHYHTDVRIAA